MLIPPFFKRLTCFIVILPATLGAQVYDDFSDGDLFANPPWEGDISLYTSNGNEQLQLNDNKEGQASLFTPFNPQGELQWSIWVRLAFSPSGNNNARVYLFSADACQACFPDGIFLQFGEAGSNDAIRLMKQENGDTSSLIQGISGTLATSFSCRVKVVYDSGQWQLFADHEGGEDYLYEGTVIEGWVQGPGYFGIACKYTVSNSQKFYFDDVYAGPVIYDTIPPEAISVSVMSPTSLEASFSENIDPASLYLPDCFTFSNDLPPPSSAEPSPSEASRVILYLQDTLPFGELIYLSVSGVTDLAGNVVVPATLAFSWYEAGRYDVVINEIMADPSPALWLPEHEYIELYNTTGLPIDLSGWSLMIGESEKTIENACIEPFAYLLLGNEDARVSLMPFGPFYGFESFGLVNTGQGLLLADGRGVIIDALEYSPDWYRDDEKADGGWSLEMIDPGAPCLLGENWAASDDYRGGSPGEVNSILDINHLDPAIVSACVLDSLRVRVEFNQSMPGDITLSPEFFTFDRGLGPAVAVLPDDHLLTSFIVYPARGLQGEMIYELNYAGNFNNCNGVTVQMNEHISVGFGQDAIWQDLVINEVLFDPFPGGEDFVEIYNRSMKVIDLHGISLGEVNHDPPAPPDTNLFAFLTPCRIILPGEYLLLCGNTSKNRNFYNIPKKVKYIEAARFPDYSNEGGEVLLLNRPGDLLDRFSYHEDMHYPLLNTTEGVSLERIHYDRPSHDATNWHSASGFAGYATPGYRNSQYSEGKKENGRVWVNPRVFSPGNDGLSDGANICYELEQPGFLANIIVFDASGRPVRHLVNNELLGTSGWYSWDGITDGRQKAPAGIYIILAELTGPDGKPERYKRTIVIAPSM